MGILFDIGAQWTNFLGGVEKRWEAARAAIANNTYTADQFARDTATTWIDGWQMWVGIFPQVYTRPLVPIVYIADGETFGTATVIRPQFAPPPPGQSIPPVTVSALNRLGGTDSINATASLAWNDMLTVTIAGSPTVAGTYQGVVSQGEYLLAVVVLQHS
jgi:hypothetical protein